MQLPVFCKDKRLKIKKIQTSELDGFLSFAAAMQLRLVWSRGESNSRPNKQLKSFLHAYFLIEFSI